MTTTFRPYEVDQQYLLPPSLQDWLPEGHLAHFVSDVVDQLDLSAIMAPYERGDGRGASAYHPKMMVKILFYAYATGKPSSRRIERATWDEVPYRVLSADQHPDHDSIAAFRQRHLLALAGLFVQVLQMAQRVGLVKLGHVALDGTKVKANASKHKAMSYERMGATEQRLQTEVEALLAAAAETDAAEDAEFGKGRRGDELPAEVQRRQSRLAKIRTAKAELEAEAQERARAKAEEATRKIEERQQKEAETGCKTRGHPPQVPDPDKAVPEPKAQRNFTDPESRIMRDGATKAFEQAYNAQAAVDGESQVIVAAEVTQEPNDKRQLTPMVLEIRDNTGQLPDVISADAGYFSEAAVTAPELAAVDLHIPPDRQKHEETPKVPAGDPATLSEADKMRKKLAEPAGRKIYARRKTIVEPVFGQIKQARGFRRFSFRGLAKVQAEWKLVCMVHNLLKIFSSGRALQPLAA
jgi:transposase